jgi:hypothetical protein
MAGRMLMFAGKVHHPASLLFPLVRNHAAFADFMLVKRAS